MITLLAQAYLFGERHVISFKRLSELQLGKIFLGLDPRFAEKSRHCVVSEGYVCSFERE